LVFLEEGLGLIFESLPASHIFCFGGVHLRICDFFNRETANLLHVQFNNQW
jgi:hypothetical protein